MAAPLASPYFTFVKWVFGIQLSIVVLTAIYLRLYRNIQDIFQNRKIKQRSLIENHLRDCVKKKKHPLNAKRYSVSDLIYVISILDKQVEDPFWENMKKDLFKNIIFPKVRRYAFSKWLSRRGLAVRCFFVFPDISNEETLLQLLKDPIPMIKYAAVFATVKLASEEAVRAIIEEMDLADRFLRQPFIDAMLRGGKRVTKYVEKILTETNNPYTKVSCLEILSHHMNEKIMELAQNELFAEHKNLRIAAIRALGHFPGEKSAHLLIPLLQDPEWEIRAIAAWALGMIGARLSITELQNLLRDKAWWVRMNAAVALKKMGKEGIQALSQIDPTQDRYAYEIAQYVLALDVEGEKK